MARVDDDAGEPWARFDRSEDLTLGSQDDGAISELGGLSLSSVEDSIWSGERMVENRLESAPPSRAGYSDGLNNFNWLTSGSRSRRFGRRGRAVWGGLTPKPGTRRFDTEAVDDGAARFDDCGMDRGGC